MNYAEISKETITLLYKSRESLKHSPLSPLIRVIAELRASQINGCVYCCRLHNEEARKLGLSQEKLDALTSWKTSSLFNEEEKVALQWVESLTNLDNNLKREELNKFFSEREIVDLTLCISIMNALNRIAISLRE